MLILGYNTTPHDSTGFSPFFLLFGRAFHVPVNKLFPRESLTKTVERGPRDVKVCMVKASESDDKAKRKNKKYYDRKVRGGPLVAGDRVFVRECAFDATHKLTDKWHYRAIFAIKT